MTVAVVVDGAASVPADLLAILGMTVVPMTLVVDDEVRPESDLELSVLLERAAASRVTTAAPAVGDFVSAFEAARSSADTVMVLTLATEMSSTYEAAELAARSSGIDGIRVLDTRTAAGAEALVAVAAARVAADGAEADEVEAVARAAIGQVHLVATLDDLDALERSGRVPHLVRRAATALHVKPLFEFRDGAAHALTPAHGENAARHRIVERCLADRPETPATLHVAALDALAGDRAQQLVDDVLAEVPDADWFVGAFGPVMIVHVGPGLSGLAWWWEPTS
jgi:DegV family protein with EDD domain